MKGRGEGRDRRGRDEEGGEGEREGERGDISRKVIILNIIQRGKTFKGFIIMAGNYMHLSCPVFNIQSILYILWFNFCFGLKILNHFNFYFSLSQIYYYNLKKKENKN